MWYASILASTYPLFISRPDGFITRWIGVARALVNEVVLSTFKKENQREAQSFTGSMDQE
jgi:hypothetical protein